jgi:hypothetical protein
MTSGIPQPDELCELCNSDVRQGSRLCASCSEMIVRLIHIAADFEILAASQTNVSDELQAKKARLYERALELNIFTVSE